MRISLNRLAYCARFIALLGVLALRPPLLAQEAASQGTAPAPPSVTEPASSPAETTDKVPAGRIRVRAQRQVFSPDAGLYRFYGNVSVTKSDLELHAAEMTYDAGTETILAGGDVSLTANDGQTYRGQALEYHPGTGGWQFHEWSATLSPSALGKPFVAPVYASGDAITGGTRLDLTGTHLTTCDKEHPDYELVARTVDIYPGDKLIARDIDLYVLGKRVLHLPWLFFFLRRNRPPVMPEFGRNEIEGYFARTPFQYVLEPNQLGTFRLDLTEKRGIGLGVDHFYTLGNGSGEAFAYVNPSSGDYALRLNDDRKLFDGLSLNTSFDRKRQSVLPGTPVETSNAMLRLTRATEGANTSVLYTQNNTEGSFSLHAAALALRQDFTAGDNKVSYSGEYRSNGYGAAAADDQELWNHLLYTRRLGFGDLNVRVDHHTDVDGSAFTGDTGLTRLERLPEVTLQVDQARLGWKTPGRLLLGLGEYREKAEEDALPRFLLDWQTTPKLSMTKSTSLQFNAGLRQTVYGDRDVSAQYQYRLDMSAQTKIGSLTHTLSYGLQRGDGFSPLFMDATYPRHAVTDNLQYQTPSLRLTMTAGRDLQWKRWYDIALSAEEHVGEHLSLRQNASYDPNSRTWRELTNQLDWQQDPRLALSLFTRYNLDQRQLRSAVAQLRWTVTPQWQLLWRGNYNGRTFLWNEWMVVRDLHCWEAALHIDSVLHSFGFTLRPKALDRTVIPEIGIGFNNRWTVSTGMAF